MIGVSGDLLFSLVLTDTPLYAVLVGAVVMSVAYGGLVRSSPSSFAGALAFWVLAEPRGELAIEDGAGWARWAGALAIAVLLLVFMLLLRRERERAAMAVEVAQDTIRDTSALQGPRGRVLRLPHPGRGRQSARRTAAGLLGARAGAMP